jgi:hypothetical protein
MAKITIKNICTWLLYMALVVFVVLGTAAGYAFIALRASLPRLDGDVTVVGLEAPVTVTLVLQW